MAQVFLLLSALVIAASAQYYQPQPAPVQPQPFYQYGYPQESGRGDHGRALTLGFQGPAFQPYPYAPPNFVPQQRPSSLTDSIFKRDGPDDQHRYLTPPSLKFKIGIVADKVKGENKDAESGNFKSYLREGYLLIQKNKTNPQTPNITLEFDEEKGSHELESGINYGDKGFQLATLNVFNGKLYSCDHTTGVVYELKKVKVVEKEDENIDASTDRPKDGDKKEEDKEPKYNYVAQPWLILSNEGSNKPFKCEWALVKGNQLWIGSSGDLVPKDEGKEDSELSKERQVVKQVDVDGQITDLDFSKTYEEIAEKFDVKLGEGVVAHESAEWSDLLNQWLFIPRRVTKEKKNDETWDKLTNNVGILSNDKFTNLRTQTFGNVTEGAGYVGLRFIPETQDRFILALKAGKDEEGNDVSTLQVLDIQGNEILPETKVADGTYSGVEFL
jgi:soluble calcium-activated nucleotidase 1